MAKKLPQSKTLIVYSDGAHGWVKYPIKDLIKLGIADKITAYSYMRNGYAYLEEDADATTLIKALKSQGYTIKFSERGGRGIRQSRIRNYPSYDARYLLLYATLDG